MNQENTATVEPNVVPIRTVGELKLQWSAVVHHNGYGWNKESYCLVRIYADGLRAVVILTEMKDNPATSVTNCYERIATSMRLAVAQFIPVENFPDHVTWMEQYERRPEEIALVTLVWQGDKFHHPTWRSLTEVTSRCYGVEWEELCRIAER